jgi:hypothetical protein
MCCFFNCSSAWLWTPAALYGGTRHELATAVCQGGGVLAWNETQGSHSQGPQATKVRPKLKPHLHTDKFNYKTAVIQ